MRACLAPTLGLARKDQRRCIRVRAGVAIDAPALQVPCGVSLSALHLHGSRLPSALHLQQVTVQQVAPEAAFPSLSEQGVPASARGPLQVVPGERVGDGEAEAQGSQSCTWAECAEPQRGEWGRLGPGSPLAAPTRRPAQSSPARAAPATDRLALFMDTRGAVGPARPGHAHTRVGDSPCHNHDTRSQRSHRAGWGMGHGTDWLLVLFCFFKKKVLGVDVRVGGGGSGAAPAPLKEPLSRGGGEPSLSDLSLNTHRTCYIRADTEGDGAGRGNIGGARLPAVAEAPALSTPQAWTRAGRTDR